jgi:hypothetical protein
VIFNSDQVSIIAQALKFYSENAFDEIDPRRDAAIKQLRRDVWSLRETIEAWWNRQPSSAKLFDSRSRSFALQGMNAMVKVDKIISRETK